MSRKNPFELITDKNKLRRIIASATFWNGQYTEERDKDGQRIYSQRNWGFTEDYQANKSFWKEHAKEIRGEHRKQANLVFDMINDYRTNILSKADMISLEKQGYNRTSMEECNNRASAQLERDQLYDKVALLKIYLWYLAERLDSRDNM